MNFPSFESRQPEIRAEAAVSACGSNVSARGAVRFATKTPDALVTRSDPFTADTSTLFDSLRRNCAKLSDDAEYIFKVRASRGVSTAACNWLKPLSSTIRLR